MRLENQFTVPTPVGHAWDLLGDVQRLAPCMPGASLDSVDGDRFSGVIKVKVGPIRLTYRGEAQFLERDPAAHRAVIRAAGKEASGGGTASATITTSLRAAGESTEVNVLTDLDLTGKPAQFGRGIVADVAGRLVGRFADNLAATLHPPAGTGTTGATQTVPAEPELDLVGVAGLPLLRRYGPALAVAAGVILAVVIAGRGAGERSRSQRAIRYSLRRSGESASLVP